MSSSQNHFLWLANTVVVYIKCCDKRKQREKVALSSQNGPYEVQKFINMINLVVFLFFFSESASAGFIFKYSSRHHSALIRWSHQSFSWSTWSALNAGWCAPLSCRAWAGALSDWSSSTPSTTDSDTETTPEIGLGGGRQERKDRREYSWKPDIWDRVVRTHDWDDVLTESCCTTGARGCRVQKGLISHC